VLVLRVISFKAYLRENHDKKGYFSGVCYLQGKDILKNFGGLTDLKNKKNFILATNSAVNNLIPENISFLIRFFEKVSLIL
jgi:hypothetical protein